ncbi:hypothetical protein EG827_00480 [bacterium]|nr:hypothetical protein [bacterium]
MICLLALLTAGVAGQKNVQTPYGRYGIGNLEEPGTFRTRAMGGISSGIRNNLTINFPTPASYSSIDTTSFIFDFGMDYGVIRLRDDDQTYYSQDLNFSHLMLGFPIMKGWGVAAAIVPYSNGSYNIVQLSSDNGGADNMLERHNGSGGYQKALIGTGFKPMKYISAGVNMFFIFGEITRINDFIFTDDNNYFNTRKLESSAMNGIGLDASLQFMAPLSKNRYINAGITYTPGTNLHTTNQDLVLRYSNIQTSLLSRDTLSNSTLTTTSRIPQTIRGGIAFGQNDKFTTGVDVIYTAWSQASLPGAYGTYTDVISLHAGAEYIPNKFSNYGFFNRIEYRIGCRYGESYAQYEGQNLKEFGITFGTGIPMRRSRSRISLMVDVANRGNGDEALPQETRISIGASLNFYDYWFLKRQYD